MKARVVLPCAVAALSFTRGASAVQVFGDDDKGIAVHVGVLLQPWMQLTTPGSSGDATPGVGAPSGRGPSLDFFARRVRLMSWGSVTKNLGYFVQTDQVDMGRAGAHSGATAIRDAFLTYTFMPEFRIDAGVMPAPFARHAIEGAAALNAIDYHDELIRLPAGRHFRDAGVQLRGLLAGNLIHYRMGAFQGVRNAAVQPPAAGAAPRPLLNEHGWPRFTGQLRLNLLGSEPDFFLQGIYFSARPLVSIGVGADWQSNAVYKLNGQPGSYFALSGDLFVELPLTENDEIVAKVNVFNYGEGASFVASTSALPMGGAGFFAEVGFRHDWIEPLAYFEYLQGRSESLTIVSPHVGVNFWVMKHTFNVKTDAGYRQTQSHAPMTTITVTRKDVFATVQAQLFF